MELIAAARVAKAQRRADAARPYARRITSIIEDLAKAGTAVTHPLLQQPEQVKKIGYVVFAGDRGLAGAYNSTVIRAAEREIMDNRAKGIDYSLVTVGKKALNYFEYRNYEIEASFAGITDEPHYDSAREIAEIVAENFISGDVDQVILVFTEFESLGTQELAVRQFLPLESVDTIAEKSKASEVTMAEFEFEPDQTTVLSALLPRYVESRLFSALLDAAASEHASRQRAMKAATDNAEELLVKLGRELSRARQAAITTEIAEIVGGAAALDDEVPVELV